MAHLFVRHPVHDPLLSVFDVVRQIVVLVVLVNTPWSADDPVEEGDKAVDLLVNVEGGRRPAGRLPEEARSHAGQEEVTLCFNSTLTVQTLKLYYYETIQ